MIKVSVEVREGAALFRVAVQAESISRAVSIVKGRHPGRDVRVVFPIDPEGFFPKDPSGENREEQGRQLQPLRAPSTRSR
jgi:hypothetical protein